ncbi:MAG: beta-ketoacyl-ACP synthase II [Chloroflexi bacterium]|nr:beta-ketoacyl-ACP synthase II [Chloroflexota bacterium]
MDLLRRGRPRVVITGLGAVTALGPVKQLWDSLLAGRSGIRKIETIDTEHVSVKIAAEVRNFDLSNYVDYKEARRMGRASQLAVSAAYQALEDSGLDVEAVEKQSDRVGVVVGTTFGSHELSTDATFDFRTTWRKPNPLAMVNSLPNMPAHYISKLLRALGPLTTPSTACAAGTQSIGEASELIRTGRADYVVTGGVEAILQDYTVAGFTAMTALATEYNDTPDKASRPFDKNRSGFVIGEGAAIVIIESLANALRRGARIYAEILGHASSSDGYHVAALDPSASGATRSMKWAIEDARINPEKIAYINAHGTSTPTNDVMETTAIKRAIGEHAYNTWISSTKSMLGHAFGASGAIEAVVTALSLFTQKVHPTINYETPDPECDLDYVPNTARDANGLDIALSNSFGLGGQNATLVMGRI